VVAGHKGHPEAVKKETARPTAAAERGTGRSTLAGEKPPIVGLIQRGGAGGHHSDARERPAGHHLGANQSIHCAGNSRVYRRIRHLPPVADMGRHYTVCHSRGEYARYDDGDGF